ncbi:hypothetical protein MTR67_044965 [Solanum verrucosum]|uniref:Replication factor A C-terminal domain-containing protein n=1 Tax=Solanum verrucosum TaxID=315347 RepID=A0AAF0URT9_SOLVR|nr:hypothetical protein MTR67_044965 [Solanum verrucosum]
MACQIKAIIYANEIEQYADKLKLKNTYLISTAKVKVSPTSYGKPIHKFYWVLDKEAVIEHIKPSNKLEKPLPPPTKLNIATFDRIPHMMVDFVAEIVIVWALSWYLVFSPHVLEKKQFLLTLWEDFREIEGNEIEAKMATEADLIVILGRSIGISTYQEMAISDEFQEFCVLDCSGCKQKKRTKDRKDFDCPKCNQKSTLVPRCIFQIDLIDGTATTTTSLSGELGEKLLSMTAEDIFDITCAKEHTPQSTTDRNSKKIRPLEISEVEVMATTTTAGSSNATLKFEPPTPTKKV